MMICLNWMVYLLMQDIKSFLTYDISLSYQKN